MITKVVNALNLYTDKVRVIDGYTKDTTKNGRVKRLKRCVVCDTMKRPHTFGKRSREPTHE